MTPAKRDTSTALALADDRILSKAQGVIEDMMCFADYDAEDLDPKSPPGEWVRELGYERACRRARIARMALMSKKDAPSGLAYAVAQHAAIASRRTVPQINNLNVQMVQVAPADRPPPVYEVIDE